MERICGKRTLLLDGATLAQQRRGYSQLLIDIGTGDGRFVQYVAKRWPGYFALGIDTCRELLRDASRTAPGNAIYVIANAQALPCDLYGLATYITINFPWGSLRDSLLTGDEAVMSALAALAQPGAHIDVRLNSSALRPAGWALEEAVVQVRQMLLDTGFAMQAPTVMHPPDLRQLPTTWAKRLAFGRDRRAVCLSGRRREGSYAGTRLETPSAFQSL